MNTAIIANQQLVSVDGGTFTLGAWRTRILNTEVSNINGIVSISSNQFTLQAGTYLIRAMTPCYHAGAVQSRIYNISDSTEVAVSISGISGTLSPKNVPQTVVGLVTIASAKIFEIQHQGSATATTNGFGVNSGFGTEQYTTVLISQPTLSVAIVAEQQPLGTNAGQFSALAWRTRVLNTEVADPDGIVTLSANRFTLQAGTYLITTSIPAFKTSRTQSRLYNYTDSTVVDVGISSLANAGFSSLVWRMQDFHRIFYKIIFIALPLLRLKNLKYRISVR
jgi:hypothetical protein